ncbi:hypothetical protein DAI22_10g206900 [Oryza sativa Japonica Group]|nr:hypothetical protein DAI22_10g206900 [Oryza sativa Japonica Group]
MPLNLISTNFKICHIISSRFCFDRLCLFIFPVREGSMLGAANQSHASGSLCCATGRSRACLAVATADSVGISKSTRRVEEGRQGSAISRQGTTE